MKTYRYFQPPTYILPSLGSLSAWNNTPTRVIRNTEGTTGLAVSSRASLPTHNVPRAVLKVHLVWKPGHRIFFHAHERMVGAKIQG